MMALSMSSVVLRFVRLKVMFFESLWKLIQCVCVIGLGGKDIVPDVFSSIVIGVWSEESSAETFVM